MSKADSLTLIIVGRELCTDRRLSVNPWNGGGEWSVVDEDPERREEPWQSVLIRAM